MPWLKDLEETRKNKSWRDGSEVIMPAGQAQGPGFACPEPTWRGRYSGPRLGPKP